MKTLIIDTCLGYLSIATADSKIIKEVKVPDLNQQSKLLASMVSDLLKSSGNIIGDVDTILITKGPGSFTGIRIGLSFALGVQEITHCDLYTCSTLACLKADYSGSALSTITAGVGSYFTQEFKNHIAAGDIKIMTKAEINMLTNIKVIGHYKEPGLRPDPATMLKLFRDPYSEVFSSDLAPLYIKAPYF